MVGLRLFLLSFLLVIWLCEHVQGGYMISTPRVYRSGTVQRLIVNLHGDKNTYHISALLKITRSNKVISMATKYMLGDSQTVIDIEVPSDVSVRYNQFNNIYLEVEGITDGKTAFKNKQALTLKKLENTLFIQTDKPIYKPGQTIRMRVIGIKPDLKPLDGKVDKIFINSPKSVRIMQWNDVAFKNGIASVELLLSSQPLLGEWKIQARHKQTIAEKIIDVAKYVLPKFEVTISPPPFIAVDSKFIEGTICARYTYGQLVQGQLKATIELKGKQTILIGEKIKGCYEFSFQNQDLGLVSLKQSFSNADFKITANVTEDATGVTQSAISSVTDIDPHRVKLNFNIGTPRHFKPGLPFSGKVHLSTPNGEPINEKITIKAEDDKNKVLFKKPFVATNGIVNFAIDNIPSRTKKIHLNAEHSGTPGIPDWKSSTNFECLPWYSKSSSFLALRTLIKPSKVGETVKINFVFTNDDQTSIFVYQLMCKGSVILSERKVLQTSLVKPSVYKGTFEFPVTQAMVPSCRLLLYYVRKDGEVVADSMVVDIQDKLENQVVVRLSDSIRKPGEPVQITMAATPGSTVALAGVDNSVRLLKQDKDIDIAEVTSVLSSYDVGPTDQYKKKKKCYKDEGHVDSSKAFYDSGVMFMSGSDVESLPCLPFPILSPEEKRLDACERNWFRRLKESPHLGKFYCRIYPLFRPGLRAPVRVDDKPAYDKVDKKKHVNKKRLTSPETWLWTEEIISSSSGVKTITAQVPTTKTSWYLSAFAMSSESGMGVADPSTLTVFQPFFVSFALPYSVIRGEEVSVVTTVFNYMSQCVTVRVRLTKTDHFDLKSSADQNVCICGNEAKSVKYVITPVNLGHIPLTATVETVAPSLCGNVSNETPLGISDVVTHKLLVEPEGVRNSYTYSDFICPKGSFANKIDIQLPKEVVPDSVHATVSAIGDVMGPSISGLERLLDLPSGCGEQNMINFAPNIYIMHYLNRTNQKIDAVQQKAKDFLQTGYQRELTYRRKDGSYSAFGGEDYEGSLWLTAFVLRSFSRARELIFIDKEEIKSITKWIESKQLDTGCFQKHGELFRKELKGGVSTPVTLTAYVLISLLESQVDPKSDVIVKGFQCISAQNDSVTDAYSNAIIAYALTLGRHQDRQVFFKRLMSQATVKDGLMYWGKPNEKTPKQKSDDWTPPYIRSSSANIETTAYALMALIGDGSNARSNARARPIVRWLSKQRNGQGGFSSTQDTCVTLQALSRYAEYVYGGVRTWMRIDMGFARDFSPSFYINDDNRMVLQRALIPAKLLPKVLRYDVLGRGCALIQVDVSYNAPKSDKKAAFHLWTSIWPATVDKPVIFTTEAGEELCQPLEMEVCAEWLGNNRSDMAVIDVKLVSGFTADEDSLENLLHQGDLGLKKFEINETKVVFYFNEIKNVCVSFVVHQTAIVKNTKLSHVTVYDYYDTDKSATTEYNITQKHCSKKSLQKGIDIDADNQTNVTNCPSCPQNVSLDEIQPLVCQMKTVFHVQSSKEGRERKILLSMSREEYGTNFGIKKQSGPVRIQLPEGCSCSALNQSHGTYVLLKETKTKKIRHLDLDENSMVLEEAMVNRLNISLEVLLGNCVELEIFSVPAKRRHL